MEAGDILAGLAALNIGEAAFIGTSRGGLIIHVLGTMRPSVLKAIVFNDIGPMIETAGLAHIQSYLERDPAPKTRTQARPPSAACMAKTSPLLPAPIGIGWYGLSTAKRMVGWCRISIRSWWIPLPVSI